MKGRHYDCRDFDCRDFCTNLGVVEKLLMIRVFYSVWDCTAFLRLLLHFIMQKKRLLLILIGDTAVGEKKSIKMGVKSPVWSTLAESIFDQADRSFQVLELISRKFDSAAGCSRTLIHLENLPHMTKTYQNLPHMQRLHNTPWFTFLIKLPSRLQRCIATINRWTDYCNNHEIIVSDYWLSQKHRKIIGPDGLEK